MSQSNQKIISQNLLDEIKDALENVNYGSIEIYVQNCVVTQITVRNIHKTSVEIDPKGTRLQVTTHTNAENKGSTIRNNVVIQKSTLGLGQE